MTGYLADLSVSRLSLLTQLRTSGGRAQRVKVGAAAEHDSDMGLTLGDLYTSGLLLLNAIAVLHEERFLAKRKRPMP